MTSSPKDLGALLDSWVESGRARLLESADTVTVTALDATVFRLAKMTPFSGISASKNDPLSLRL